MDFGFSKIEGFDWNEGNLEHIKRHKVKAKECEELFFNKPFILVEDKIHSQIEKRFRAYGKTDKNRLVTIIYTIRVNKVRVILARDQNKKERKQFKETGGEKL